MKAWLLVSAKVLKGLSGVGATGILSSQEACQMLGAGCDLRSMWKAFPEGSPHVVQSLDNSWKSAAEEPEVKLS